MRVKMKKIIIISIMFLLLLNFAYGLDCQYTLTEKYDVMVENFYENGNKLLTPPTFKLDVQQPNLRRVVYTVYNPWNKNATFRLDYEMPLPKGKRATDFVTVSVEPKQYKSIEGNMHAAGSIAKTKISVVSPSRFTSKTEKAIKTRKKCELCGGVVCLNDGQKANSSIYCGSKKINVNSVCVCKTCPEYILNDGKCSIDRGENCKNSLSDCKCSKHKMCSGVKCVNDPSNPPSGELYCSFSNSFKKIDSVKIGSSCGCDFECDQSFCVNNICQSLTSPKLTCPTGTNIKKGKEISCNLVADNTKLNKDVKVTFVLTAGDGLTFSESNGCQNIKGSQCIGTYSIADLSNEGVEVKLTALASGNTNISGKVRFPYKTSIAIEKVNDLSIHIFDCGDGKIDAGETKETCCSDVGIKEYSFIKFYNEECKNNKLIYIFNWHLFLILFVLFASGMLFAIKFIVKQLIALSEAEQKKIATEIDKIQSKIQDKHKEIEIDKNLIHKLEKEKDKKEELAIITARIKQSHKQISELRRSEKAEKEKLKKDRLTPYTNKQGYEVIINKNGYEQFVKNLKYPDEEGQLFHRWYAWKKIYIKNRKKYPLKYKEYEIHHKDGNKRNNALSNLEILSKEEHKKRHNL